MIHFVLRKEFILNNKQKKVIDIVMTSDSHYILQTRVTICTAQMASSKSYIYFFHILCSKKLSMESREKLYGLQKIYENLRIEFIEVDESIFSSAIITSFYTVASYYRLVMTEVINADKCLFLDGDLIIQTDLSCLFETDIEDKYIAGVLDCGIQSRIQDFEEHRKCIGLADMEHYINAGVLLWNLKKMREVGLFKEFISYIDKGYPSMDNDVINKCCYGRIKYINIKYNVFVDFLDHLDVLKQKGYKESELENLTIDNMILHFSGRFKPWLYLRTNYAEIWWKEAERALDKCDYNILYAEAKKTELYSDIKATIERCQSEKKVVIVGYTRNAKNIVDILLKENVGNIVAFADNDKEKVGENYRDIKVMLMEDVVKFCQDALWIIASQNFYSQLHKQLLECGIIDSMIIRYIEKSETYYSCIDKKYMELEVEDRMIRNSGVDK